MDYADYKELKIRRLEPGILEIVMGEEGGKLSVTNARMHAEMASVWLDVDRDPETRVAVLRGAGRGFSAGGDLGMIEEMMRDFAVRARVWREARDLVYNLINCSKMVVSAMHGPAVGAGLVAGLLADISIAAKDARIIDGHTRLGVAAGSYVLYAGRGFEYGIASARFTVASAETRQVPLRIRREVPTPGLIASDTHLHTLTHSRHGDATIEERMLTIAGEGIELAVATDHNHHTDYTEPAIRTGVADHFRNSFSTPRTDAGARG